MTIDPNFASNNYLYFFYTAGPLDKLKQHISRFKISKDNKLDVASEKVIIEVPIEAEVSAHTGGSMAWDKNGNLFISTGDNTVPFESEGFAVQNIIVHHLEKSFEISLSERLCIHTLYLLRGVSYFVRVVFEKYL